MRKNFKYTPEVLKRIATLRAQGLTWAQVTSYINEEFNQSLTSATVRVSFAFHADDRYEDADVETDSLLMTYRSRETAKIAKRQLNKTLAARMSHEDFLQGIKQLVHSMPKLPKAQMERAPIKKGTPMTVEILFSDLQIGKIMNDYNSEIAAKRVKEYTQVAIAEIRKAFKNGFNVERIVVPLLGDIIESAAKHEDSALGCDSSTPEQVASAIEVMYINFLRPLAQLGMRVDVFGIPGNHDHDGHGLRQFKPGRTQLNWPMYKALELLCQAQGLSNVSFTIPEGTFTTTDIYGHKVLYEHGVKVSATEVSMQKQVEKRMKQVKSFITYFRMGDKHCNISINNGRLVVNGAFFGADDQATEFSSICGFDSQPGQAILFYVPREDSRLPLYDMFVVQLAHII